MKFEKQIEDFIQKRIEGKSFDEIATDLKTTKQTLIEWNKQLKVRNTINEGQSIKINSIVKTYSFDLNNRLNTYLKLSKKINDELAIRDLTQVNTETLLKMSIANDTRVRELVNKNTQLGVNDFVVDFGNSDGWFSLKLDE
jgi:hypothetical protein